MAVELATAFVSLVTDSSKIPAEVDEQLGKASKKAESAGTTMGNTLSGGIGKALKFGGVGAAAAVGGLMATALGKGFERLKSIDEAKAKLVGLGNSAGDVQKIMDSAMASVKGTAFGMGDAATVAASSVAAGIKPGEDLTKNLKLVADAATIAGTDMGSMGAIFNKVATSNKVQGDILNQLGDRGIPIVQLLAKQMNVSADAVTDLAAKGKIDFATFSAAMQTGMGGAALASGKTFKGSIDNTMAALGRLGATALGPLFNALPNVLGSITTGLDNLGKIVTPVMGSLSTGLGNVFTGAKALFDLVFKGDFTSAFRNIFGVEEDAPIVGQLLSVRDNLISAFDAAKNFGTTLSTLLWPIVKTVGGVLFDLGRDALPIVAGAFGLLFDIIGKVSRAISGTINFFKEHKDVAIALGAVIGTILLPALLSMTVMLAASTAGWIVGKTILVAWTVASKIAAAGQWLLNAAMSANPIGLLVAALVALVAGIVLAYRHSETFRDIVQAVWAGIQVAISTVWGVIKTVFDGMVTGVQAIGSAFSWVWNSVIQPVWNALGAGVSWVWNNVVSPAFEGMKTGLSLIGDAFSFIWNNVIQPVWNALGTGISWVIDNVIKPAFEGFKSSLGAVKDFFGTVVDGIRIAWDKIKSAVAVPINFVINTVWNNGLVKAWNAVAGWLPGLPNAKPLAPVAFRSGGAVGGGTPGKDSVPALLMPKEHVWDMGSVAAAGGQKVMYAMRSLIKRGIPFSWDTVSGLSNANSGVVNAIATAPPNADLLGFLGGIVPGFKDGGEVRPAWEYQLEAGHEFAQSKNHDPYVWGVTDCSSYMSMIADKILGGPGVRRWATASFPGGQPWVPGLGQGFSVGVHDDPGGPGGGHTSGTLSAVGRWLTTNVESGGSHGDVAYGGAAAGADSPQWDGVRPGRFHLGIGADGAFVSGGVGGGPSPDDQKSFLSDKLRKVIDTFLAPVTNMLPHPPPEVLGVPKLALDGTRDAAIRVASDVIHGLGSGLRSVFEGASKVGNILSNPVGSAWEGISSVFRDTGGFIPNGLTLVRNETGKPEAVLNWEQLEQVRKMMTDGKSFTDAIKALNVKAPSDEDAGKANRTLGPGTSVEQLRSLIFDQKMATVTATSTKEFAGNAGKIIGESLWDIVTPFSDFPDPLAIADRYTLKDSDAKTPETQSAPSTETPEVATPALSPTDYVGNIAKAAKDKNLPLNAAIIGVGTAITESALKMYANSNVVESLKLPHDAVGSDHDSVGLFQQRPSWGPIADLMDAYKSAGLFYDKLGTFDWQSMAKGAAAQKVQVSAFPDRYEGNMPEAEKLLKGKFDQGGMIPPGLSLMDNQTKRYEPAVAFNPEQWANLSELANGGGGSVDARLVVEKLVVQDWREAQKQLKTLGNRHKMRYAGRPSK